MPSLWGLIFGGDEVTLSANVNQDIQNSVYQNFSTSCEAKCDNFAEGTYVIIIDSKVSGGVRFDQKCTVTANCAAENTAEAVVQNVLDATAEQSAFIQNSFITLGGATLKNNLNIDQKLRNQLTQVLSSSCSATARSIARNTVLYVKNSETKEVAFTQSGEVTANCTLNNTGKISLFNDVVAEAKQTATVLSFVGGIALIIGVVVIVAVLGFAASTIFKKGSSTEGSSK